MEKCSFTNARNMFIIFRRGSITSGSTSFRSLDGTGSNIQVVGLDGLTILYNSSFQIEENEWNCSSGDLQRTI